MLQQDQMCSGVFTCVANGEPEVKTVCEILYKFFVRVVSKKCGKSLNVNIYWRENTR